MKESSLPLVVITGASSGIGAATAQAFSKLGHPLLLIARRIDRMKDLGLPRSLIVSVDVNDSVLFEKAIMDAEAQFGPADLIVNNAGVMLLGQVSEQDPGEWEKMFQVNVMGVLNGTRMVLKGMLKRRSGTIINVSSVAGKKSFPNHAVYCGTKFAVHAMSECIREEIADSNVRLITVAPGAVETELLSHTTSNEIKNSYQDWKETIGGAIRAEDIARTIVFAYNQPQNVCIREIVVAATRQGP